MQITRVAFCLLFIVEPSLFRTHFFFVLHGNFNQFVTTTGGWTRCVTVLRCNWILICWWIKLSIELYFSLSRTSCHLAFFTPGWRSKFTRVTGCFFYTGFLYQINNVNFVCMPVLNMVTELLLSYPRLILQNASLASFAHYNTHLETGNLLH